MAPEHSKQQTYRRIKDTSKSFSRIDAKRIAAALGAEPAGTVSLQVEDLCR